MAFSLFPTLLKPFMLTYSQARGAPRKPLKGTPVPCGALRAPLKAYRGLAPVHESLHDQLCKSLTTPLPFLVSPEDISADSYEPPPVPMKVPGTPLKVSGSRLFPLQIPRNSSELLKISHPAVAKPLELLHTLSGPFPLPARLYKDPCKLKNILALAFASPMEHLLQAL